MLVIEGLFSHVFHDAVFPIPANAETWSHPLKAWKKSRPLLLSSPRFAASWCIGMYRRCLPVPNVIHSSSSKSCENMPIAITTTSVSKVEIITVFIPVDVMSCMQYYSVVGFFMVAW